MAEANCWDVVPAEVTSWTSTPRESCDDAFYRFYDTETGLLYAFDPVALTFEEIPMEPDVVGGWILNDGFRLWIAGGFMYFSDSGFPQIVPYVEAPVDTLQVVDGVLESNP